MWCNKDIWFKLYKFLILNMFFVLVIFLGVNLIVFDFIFNLYLWLFKDFIKWLDCWYKFWVCLVGLEIIKGVLVLLIKIELILLIIVYG